MNKKDLLPILLLLVLFLAYPTIDRKFISRIFPAKEKPVPTAQNAAAAPDLPAETTLTAPAPTPMLEAAVAPEPAELEAQAPDLPEEITILRNEKLELAVSSHGAGIVRAAILGYPATRGAAAPVTFDFEDHPALSISGVLAANAPFKPVAASGRTASFRKVLAGGLELVRSITLGEGYQLDVKDQFTNPTDNVLRLSGYGLNAGFMGNLPDEKMDRVPLLGVDTLTGSQSVEYWGAKFEKWFPNLDRGIQAQTVPGPMEPAQPVDWLAVKNKYFTQIITPETYAEKATLFVKRGAPLKTTAMLFFPRTSYPFDVVSATLTLPEQAIDPGRTLTHSATFYIGPKVYADLKANGPHQEDILQLGFWRPIGILILKIMVWFHDHIWPYNYGLAIILLTFLIRIIFWPLNHKAMASTRHMQAIQPLMAGLKEKYKNDPARQQQEMMALYKEHKINPMGGCLPMLIQIPVFFALFVVLRGAIELRFSSFLWINDLSTPENLFADKLPIPLNILPIFMGVTMWIQQRMTPTSDPQQQRMMMLMPVIFTVMFYSFPSGLSLYWSTNQVMMIVQQFVLRKFHPLPVLTEKK